jgi:soluble lytic murein transglycosylase
MRSALEYAPRRRKKRRAPKTRLVLPLLVILLLLAVVYYMFFFPKAVREIAYPLAYQDEIKKNAAEYDLDPARVAAVIYRESSFRPEAVSGVGARGLMQIMPETGGWIAKKLGEESYYTDEKLFEPALNIRYGCWYLNYLDGRYGGDLTKATAAYHAGGTRVDEWLSDKANSEDGVTLASIPSEVTRDYVADVKAAYEHYKEKFQS